MLVLLALLLAAVVLGTGEAEKRAAPAGEPGADLHLAELVDASLDLSEVERKHMAKMLEAAGEKALAAKLLRGREGGEGGGGGIESPGGAPSVTVGEHTEHQIRAVRELVTAWQQGGADDIACLGISPTTIGLVQRAFGLEETGVYDVETAMYAQEVDAAAPASCLPIDLGFDEPVDANAWQAPPPPKPIETTIEPQGWQPKTPI